MTALLVDRRKVEETLADAEMKLAALGPGGLAHVLTKGRELQSPHLDVIDSAYVKADAEGGARIIVTMPPRHGKSRRVSRWGPAWWLWRNPDQRVIVTSYAATLAAAHGRWVRDTVTRHGYRLGLDLDRSSKASNNWDLAYPYEGGMMTAGVGGGITGHGADLFVVDDPYSNRQAADSPIIRGSVEEWWTSTGLTRLEPGASVIILHTRWHPDDLIGTRIKQEGIVEEGGLWTVINLPAICEDTDDAIGRQPGEALWVARYPEPELRKIQRAVGVYDWASLYQQEPAPREGGIFSWESIEINRRSTVPPNVERTVIAIDVAVTAKATSDETGIIAGSVARDAGGRRHAYVTHDRSGRYAPNVWARTACLLAIEIDADAFVFETNQGGDMIGALLKTAWKSLEEEGLTGGKLMPRLIPVHAKKGKLLRAEPVSQQYSEGFAHHVGRFPILEGQMTTYIPGQDSPDRLDANVYLLLDLLPAPAAPARTASAKARRTPSTGARGR